MIYKGDIEVIARYYGSKIITATYKGTKLIWEAINSCFGSGAWYNDKGWSNNDGWK